ncbi:ACT domain [Musa troglodytarum]|uniref:ACT domain-containing protein ACR n=1 Tax=Musa troglodytarum TaxID=320322 RepID=A0A9E7GW67_9LILI|nr:ACT domain [Musa troglodytarum]
MGIPSDDVVIIRPPERPGEPSLITISCPDKTGLGCDLCRVILLFGTDGKWCYVLLWVVERGRKATRWALLKKRLIAACPPASSPLGIDSYYFNRRQETATEQNPQVFLFMFSCYDRMGLLHDVTEVLCELELTIRRVKVSTTPDGRVVDLFLVTDTSFSIQRTGRTGVHSTESCLGDSMCSCDIELASAELAECLQASSSLPPSVTEEMITLEFQEEPSSSLPRSSVSVDNSLSHAHSLIQIQCHDHKGLLYDIMRTLKDYNIQISYGRFNAAENGNCNIDLLLTATSRKLYVLNLISRGPDTELIVANPVELSGKGRPLVFYDITLALKILKIRIFLAEIGRHVVGDREWEVYRVHLGDDHELCESRDKIVEAVTKMGIPMPLNKTLILYPRNVTSENPVFFLGTHAGR